MLFFYLNIENKQTIFNKNKQVAALPDKYKILLQNYFNPVRNFESELFWIKKKKKKHKLKLKTTSLKTDGRKCVCDKDMGA
jgi:hypothetical protein